MHCRLNRTLSCSPCHLFFVFPLFAVFCVASPNFSSLLHFFSSPVSHLLFLFSLSPLLHPLCHLSSFGSLHHPYFFSLYHVLSACGACSFCQVTPSEQLVDGQGKVLSALGVEVPYRLSGLGVRGRRARACQWAWVAGAELWLPVPRQRPVEEPDKAVPLLLRAGSDYYLHAVTGNHVLLPAATA